MPKCKLIASGAALLPYVRERWTKSHVPTANQLRMKPVRAKMDVRSDIPATDWTDILLVMFACVCLLVFFSFELWKWFYRHL
jgi:hypothetical protein